MKLNFNERKVLGFLVEYFGPDGGYWSFAGIEQKIGVDRKTIRRACRSLRRKGLAECHHGLWNDEGPAGSGYGATKAGAEFVAGAA